jgi:hypothetical protein
MVSLKSIELKQGAEEPSMEEAERFDLKLPVEIKRTARIHCRGRLPTGAIASRNPRQRGERPYSRSKVGAHPWYAAEGL